MDIEKEFADILNDYSEKLRAIIRKAFEDDKQAQKDLEDIFNEKWVNIKSKLEDEDIDQEWWMDGLQQFRHGA